MTFSEKLTELRRQKGWSQEELGDRLGVTRQTVSKWELGSTTPEMEKLVAMSELFGISLDELIVGTERVQDEPQALISAKLPRFVNGEFRSKKTWRGKPFVHINFKGKANGFLAIGLMARGIFSIGLMSMGVVTMGLLSLGVVVVTAFAGLGIAVNAMAAAGIFAFGAVAAGVFAFGAIAFGWAAYGAVSGGVYAIGAFARGTLAVGDTAEGIVAVGKETVGEIELHLPITAEEFRSVVESRLPNTPKFILDMFSWFARNMRVD